MQSSDVPSRFPIPFGNAAGGSYIRTIPEASQIGIQDGAASLTDGFPPLNFTSVGAGGVPPFGQDFNGLMKQVTQWSRWQAAGNATKYDAAFSTAIGGYPKGAVLSSTTAGKMWLSMIDNNTSDPDGVSPSGWLLVSNVSQVTTYSTPGVYSWICPAGVTRVLAKVWGAGGAGGSTASSANSLSASGAGGGYTEGLVDVIPGTSYAVNVGAGGVAGAAGPSPAPSTGGGTSAFAGVLSSTGGAAGLAAAGSIQTSTGNGGVGSGGYFNFSGGPGGSGTALPSGFLVPSGGYAYAISLQFYGAVGALFNGRSGLTPAGGGGASYLGGTGGAGGGGLVILQY